MSSIIDRTGHYTIVPTHSFSVTAKIIADSLGVPLSFDDSGRYEEYPAFVGKGKGVEIVFLGIPKPEDDLEDPPANTFGLEVTVTEIREGLETPELMDAMVLNAVGLKAGLSCSVEGWGT